MPTSGGKIFTQIIDGVEYGISVQDVSTCIGDNRTGISDLCTSPKIKDWSKFKPIKVDTVQNLPEDSFKSRNYGLSFPKYNELTTMYNARGARWEYERPTLYFRITDFNGYNHNAKSPLPYLADSTEVGWLSIDTELTIPIHSDVDYGDTETDNILLSDLNLDGISFSNLYLGVILISPSGQVFYMTSKTPGLDKNTLTLPWSGNKPTGTYTAWLFASLIPVDTFTGNAQLSTYILLDQKEAKTITFTQLFNWQINVDYVYLNLTELKGEIVITYKSTAARTFPALSLGIYTFAGAPNESPGVNDEIKTGITIPSVSVSANGTTTQRVSFTITAAQAAKNKGNAFARIIDTSGQGYYVTNRESNGYNSVDIYEEENPDVIN